MLLRERLRFARRFGEEEGFTVTETVTALGVILASLVALAYTSTAGFSDIGYARERQAATGLANQAMENARALPFATLQKGLDNADLAQKKDPSITQSGTE